MNSFEYENLLQFIHVKVPKIEISRPRLCQSDNKLLFPSQLSIESLHARRISQNAPQLLKTNCKVSKVSLSEISSFCVSHPTIIYVVSVSVSRLLNDFEISKINIRAGRRMGKFFVQENFRKSTRTCRDEGRTFNFPYSTFNFNSNFTFHIVEHIEIEIIEN